MRRWRVGVHQLTISSSPAVHVAKQRGLPYLLQQLKGKVELLAQEGVGDMSEFSKADMISPTVAGWMSHKLQNTGVSDY